MKKEKLIKNQNEPGICSNHPEIGQKTPREYKNQETMESQHF
jgi:hypothetical protein